jgi:hypothetical protein
LGSAGNLKVGEVEGIEIRVRRGRKIRVKRRDTQELIKS